MLVVNVRRQNLSFQTIADQVTATSHYVKVPGTFFKSWEHIQIGLSLDDHQLPIIELIRKFVLLLNRIGRKLQWAFETK